MDRQICCWVGGGIPRDPVDVGSGRRLQEVQQWPAALFPGCALSPVPNGAWSISAKRMGDGVIVTPTTTLFPLLWPQGAFVSSQNASETEPQACQITDVFDFMHVKDPVKKSAMTCGWGYHSMVGVGRELWRGSHPSPLLKHRIKSRWVLNISRVGDSIVS